MARIKQYGSRCPHIGDYRDTIEKVCGTIYKRIVFPETAPDRARKARETLCRWCDRNLEPSLCCCLHCSHFACLTHMRMHFKEHKHVFALHLTQGHLYCYKCGDFVYDRTVEGLRRDCENGFRRIRGFTFGKHQQLWNPSQAEIEVLHSENVLVLPRDLERGLRGVLNLGNTCFISCIIQAFMHTSLLRDYFITDQHNCKVGELCLICEISSIFQEFYNGHSQDAFMPNRLLHLVWKNEKHLAGYEQQDAHEFMIAALSTMHHQARSSSLNTTTLDCKCIIDRIYTGQLQSDVRCESCGSVSRKLDPFRDLSLNVDQTTNGSVSITLAECLRKYIAPEPLDGGKGIKCENCSQVAARTQQLTLHKLPLVMCFHLKRIVHHRAKKTNIDVVYPEVLDVTEFTSPQVMKTQNGLHTSSPEHDSNEKLNSAKNRYELFAVVNHFGTTEAGHYTCFVKHNMRKWYLCDDEHISATTPEVVLASEGYLLFYHKQYIEYE
ncbi:hypothetical protein L596_024406 [Steinernema carpocapsae]|uniref:Ubiquitin carboxyl-terminal hydrolase n=1 Tax=Steinernema carpocapsae TaxID=34508 RepID=A0A4U5MGN0_STECR|nr:hypothetical protein L596_024406 [Steinernema carpocapsae]